MEEHARPGIAPPEEDPNAILVGSSPPCFLHELDPSHLGYLRGDEVAALLEDLLAAEWPGTLLEAAWLRAMLRRHLARLDRSLPQQPDRSGIGAGGGKADAGQAKGSRDELARRLRTALPRIHDETLCHDLTALLLIMDRDLRRRHPRAEAD